MSLVLLVATSLLLFLAPLPFGGNEEWAIFGLEASAALLFALHCLFNRESRPEATPPVALKNQLKLIGLARSFGRVIFLLFLGALVFQIIPLPFSLIKFFSPAVSSIWLEAERLLRGGELALFSPEFGRLSLAPTATLSELLKILAYAAFAFLIWSHARTRRRVEFVVLVLIASGLFQAVYGLIGLWSDRQMIFGWPNPYNQGSAFGTFVNRDHFAAYLEMTFALAVGYLLAKTDFFSLPRRATFRQRVLWFSQEKLAKAFILGLVIVIMGVGIFFSRSRSAIINFFILLSAMSLALSWSSGRKEAKSKGESAVRRRWRRLLRTLALAVLLTVVIIGIEPIIERFSLESLAREMRPHFYQNAARLIRLHWATGVGAGAFVYAYPHVEDMNIRGILDHAHNDYLELLAEVGVIAGSAIILLTLAIFLLGFEVWQQRHDYFVRGVGLGSWAAFLALLVHSFSDFSLRMPANALTFVAAISLGLRTLSLSRND